jgi:hypothetical protein
MMPEDVSVTISIIDYLHLDEFLGTSRTSICHVHQRQKRMEELVCRQQVSLDGIIIPLLTVRETEFT